MCMLYLKIFLLFNINNHIDSSSIINPVLYVQIIYFTNYKLYSSKFNLIFSQDSF